VLLFDLYLFMQENDLRHPLSKLQTLPNIYTTGMVGIKIENINGVDSFFLEVEELREILTANFNSYSSRNQNITL
jgi:hypothetical protein